MSLLTGIQKVRVPAPAKINLFLSVGGEREDGFHELHGFGKSQTSGHGGNREIR